MPEDDKEKLAILLASAMANDSSAFDQLEKKYRRFVIHYCSQFFHDPGKGEDAAQEVFLRAWKYLRSFRADGSFTSWLRGIANNVCSDLLKKQGVILMDLDVFDQNAHCGNAKMPDPLHSFEERQVCRQMVDAVLARLDPTDRTIFSLRFGITKTDFTEQLEYKEIARLIGMSEEALRSRVHRKIKPITEEIAREFDI